MLQSRDTPSLLFAFCCILQLHTERMVWHVFDQYHGPGLSLLFMSHCIAYNSSPLLFYHELTFKFTYFQFRSDQHCLELLRARSHWVKMMRLCLDRFFLSNRLHSHHTVLFGQPRGDSASNVFEQVTMSIGWKIPWYHGNASPHSFGPLLRLTWCWRCHDED